MTSKLKCPMCPYCDKLLHCDGTQYINEHIVEMWYCQNPECEESEDLIGTREMWEQVARLAKIRASQKKYWDKISKEKRQEYYRNSSRTKRRKQ